ncbi:MAG: hypothetical protein HPY53_11900 [Brevinematales bacterium]|nr:hypothetical protein [Brevinematales bacterium]
MPYTFAFVFTAIIIISSLSLFLLPTARMFPFGMRVGMVLLPIALIWLHTFLYRISGEVNFFSHLLMVLFYFFTFAMVLPMSLGTWGIGIMDLPKREKPVKMGNQTSAKEIAIVYHPGGSPFTKFALTRLADAFAGSDYAVTLYTASGSLALDTKKPAAIVLASPVYGSMIRPALQDFIAGHDLSGVKLFIIHTGGGPLQSEEEFSLDINLLKDKGAKLIGKTKFVMIMPDQAKTPEAQQQLDQEIAKYAQLIKDKLK